MNFAKILGTPFFRTPLVAVSAQRYRIQRNSTEYELLKGIPHGFLLLVPE